MINIPDGIRLSKIPKLYETEEIPLKDKLMYLHFFVCGCDWYVAEYDGDDLFWGYTILNNDTVNAEWGYFLFSELKEIKVFNLFEVDCETEDAFPVRKASEIARINLTAWSLP